MSLQCRQTGLESVTESRRNPQPVDKGSCQHLGAPPGFVGNAGVQVRCGECVWQSARASRGEGHRRHVVRGREFVRASLFRDKRHIAIVHVRIANEHAEGPQEFYPMYRLPPDFARGGKSIGDIRPCSLSRTNKFGIECSQRKHTAPPE